MCPILIAIKFGKGLRIKELSPGLRLFFCSHVIFSILGIPYQLYRILFWISPSHETIENNYGNQYSPYLLFWLSMPEFVFYGAIPSVVLLLTVERCIALRITLTWVNKTYRWISLAIFMAIVGVNMLGHLLELPLFDDNPELSKLFYFCGDSRGIGETYRDSGKFILKRLINIKFSGKSIKNT